MLRSFLPFGTPALVWDHGVKKTNAPGRKATVLCKDPYGFGYLFYVPFYKKIVSTVNYELPAFKPNQENNSNIDVGIFKELSNKTLGEYMDQKCDENEIEEVFPIPESTSPELMVSLEEDERLIKKQLIRDIEDEKTDDRNDVTNKDPANIDHENLEEFFEENVEKECHGEEHQGDINQSYNETNVENNNEDISSLEENPDYYPIEDEDDSGTDEEDEEDEYDTENIEEENIGLLEENMENVIQQEKEEAVNIQEVDNDIIQEAFEEAKQVAYEKMNKTTSTNFKQDTIKQLNSSSDNLSESNEDKPSSPTPTSDSNLSIDESSTSQSQTNVTIDNNIPPSLPNTHSISNSETLLPPNSISIINNDNIQTPSSLIPQVGHQQESSITVSNKLQEKGKDDDWLFKKIKDGNLSTKKESKSFKKNRSTHYESSNINKGNKLKDLLKKKLISVENRHMTDTNTRTDQPSKNNKPEYEENKRFIKEGNKKRRVRKIYSKYNSEIKAIYYNQDITKNKNLEQKERFLEAYQKVKTKFN